MAKKDVTNDQGGASDEQDQDQTPQNNHPVNENLSERDRIIKKRVEEFEKDAGVKVDREVDDEPPAPAASQDESDDDELDEKPAAAAAAAKPATPTYKIVVDGEEREVPIDQLIEAGKRTLQKETAADKRLEEASRLLKEAKAAKEKPAAAAEQDEKPTEKKQEPDKSETTPDIEALQKAAEEAEAEYIKAINYGEEDEAIEASRKARMANEAYLMAKIGGGYKPPTIDPDKIANEVQTRIKYANIMSDLRKPVADGGFEDIVSNPHLYGWAAQEVDKLIASGEPGDDFATYRKACESVRSSILNWQQAQGGDNGNNDQPTRKSTTTKIEKKRKLDSIDSAAGRQPGPKDEKPPDTREVINKMARNRIGQ